MLADKDTAVEVCVLLNALWFVSGIRASYGRRSLEGEIESGLERVKRDLMGWAVNGFGVWRVVGRRSARDKVTATAPVVVVVGRPYHVR